jgi:hypothetical protein
VHQSTTEVRCTFVQRTKPVKNVNRSVRPTSGVREDPSAGREDPRVEARLVGREDPRAGVPGSEGAVDQVDRAVRPASGAVGVGRLEARQVSVVAGDRRAGALLAVVEVEVQAGRLWTQRVPRSVITTATLKFCQRILHGWV